ncbi:hypothetical protein RhiirA5_441468 [Rhizophagus irregularis]|uniref:Uncharacterized protein n=1 Tax=Rhizophagus irregularis TaxID=588596 RepID=A0A2N0NFK5_9GLOM|nr:hypothetical protein RhiirA5_441468 [Rhizophagus irregularis]
MSGMTREGFTAELTERIQLVLFNIQYIYYLRVIQTMKVQITHWYIEKII